MDQGDFPAFTLLVIIGLLVLSGLFSGSETALFSLPKTRRRRMESDGTTIGERIKRLFKEPRRLLIAILLGNTIINVLATSLTEGLFADYSKDLSVILSVFFVTPILVLFGEITPKVVALAHAERLARFLAVPFDVFVRLTRPVTTVFARIVSAFERIIGDPPYEVDAPLNEEEIRSLARQSYRESQIQSRHVTLIDRFLRFRELDAIDIMTPRAMIVAVDIEDDIDDVLEAMRKSGFSRIPIYEGGMDNIVGIVHGKDLLGLTSEELARATIRNAMKAPLYAPFSRSIRALMRDMRAKKKMFTVVLDEHGGVAGIVTMEDVLEEIVGEIYDLLDDEDEHVIDIGIGRSIIHARMSIEAFNRQFGAAIETEEAETIGGLIFNAAGHVPDRKETILVDEFVFRALRVRENRMITVEIRPRSVVPDLKVDYEW